MATSRSPFPGMDPYLEDPAIWPDFHDSLVTYIRDSLQTSLPEPYYASIQDRVYLEEPDRWIVPDARVTRRDEPVPPPRADPRRGPAAIVIEDASVEVREPLVEIRDTRSGHRVITVLEVLSPANKRAVGEGARLYRIKQQEILGSDASLVEIDLLRGGEHVAAVRPALLERYRPYDYLVVVRRASFPSRREVYPIPVRSVLPRIGVPLRDPDPDVTLDLGTLVQQAYERGAYAKRLDYSRPAAPPLSADDAAWAKGLFERS